LFFQVARALVVLGIGYYILGGVWQIDLSSLATAAGVSSLVIALALQDTLSNLVSGLLLLISKPFKTGDWVNFNGTEGRIIEQNWWGVTLEYIGWEKTITVPNGVLSNATIDNYGPNGFWYSVDVEFSYDDPPDLVLKALNNLNQGFEELNINQFLMCPDLYSVIKEFGASGIVYRVWFKRPADRKGIMFKNVFFSRIYYMAKREGFTIPYPMSVQYKVDATDGLPEEIPQVSTKNRDNVLEHLRNLPYFQSLEQTEIITLASRAEINWYGNKDIVIAENFPDDKFHIVLSGKVQIWTSNQEGTSQMLSQLSVGEVFGEMALTPGELSPVTAIVTENTRIIQIDIRDIVSSTQSNSKFGFEMSKFIEGRKKALNLAKGIFEENPQRVTSNGKWQNAG
ncbi:MAG: cyclic nucleotide-binding domain-containing protein, partial [Bacteroidota bacterium]